MSLLAVAGSLQPAAAQGTPRGSYLGSCTDDSVRGDTLSASCRRRDGREDRSALSDFNRCVGDIGNDNGVLRCALPGGGQARGQVVAEPGTSGQRYVPPPGYAPGPGYTPPPAYGEREGGRFERCRRLHQESEELRARLDRERDPADRDRIERRLHEMHDEAERCR